MLLYHFVLSLFLFVFFVGAADITSCRNSDYEPSAHIIYTLKNNLRMHNMGFENCISFDPDSGVNITLDGQGHSIICAGSCNNKVAVYLEGASSASLTIINVTFENFANGVVCADSGFRSASILNSKFINVDYGLSIRANSLGTISVAQTEFTGGTIGINVRNNVNIIAVENSTFSNISFAFFLTNGVATRLSISFTNFSDCPTGIFVNNEVRDVIITNSEFLRSSFGLETSLSSKVVGLQVTGSKFVNVTTGIHLRDQVENVQIDGNTFTFVTTAASTNTSAKITNSLKIANNIISGNLQKAIRSAFRYMYPVNTLFVAGNQVSDKCFGAFTAANFANISGNNIQGCQETGIFVTTYDPSVLHILDNTMSLVTTAQDAALIGIQVSSQSNSRNLLTMVGNMVQDVSIECGTVFRGIYINTVNNVTMRQNTVSRVSQRNFAVCANNPSLVGIYLENIITLSILQAVVDKINSTGPSTSNSSNFPITGIKLVNTVSTIISDSRISNIRATHARECVGAACMQNNGFVAIGLHIASSSSTSNFTTNGLDIYGIYGGNGGVISSPPANAYSVGGDAFGIYAPSIYLRAINTTISDVIGGNGGFFSTANFSTCPGGKGYAVYNSSSLSASTIVSPQNISNGSACVGSCGDGECTSSIGENCTSCSADCGTCNTTTVCGNNICELATENCVTCPFDCDEQTCGVCGDGVCDSHESCQLCYEDCRASCASECVLPCSSRGTCSGGVCVCEPNWSGPTCSSSQNRPIDILPNITAPNVDVNIPELQNLNFLISVRKIEEIQATSSSNISFSFDSIAFNRSMEESGRNKMYNYSGILPNGAHVNVLVYFFGEPETRMKYADEEMLFGANTLKFGIEVHNWPFRTLSSKLAITFDANVGKSEEGGNACLSSNANVNTLNWLAIVVNDVVLYGKFSEKAIVDGRIRTITFKLQDDSVVATLPHFWSSVSMDPQYSVLLGDSNKGTCVSQKQKKSNNVTTLVIAIVVPVVVVAGILIALAIVYGGRMKSRAKTYVAKKQLNSLDSS